jgi:hypothetical protein
MRHEGTFERRWHTDFMEPAAPIGSGDDWESEPIGPDDLTIRTPNGTVAEPESWLALVHSTLRKPGGFLIVSSGPPNVYAQAINHEGRFLLEYRDGSPDQHFQAKDVSLASIADALSQWMRGDRTFIDDHEWKPLSI